MVMVPDELNDLDEKDLLIGHIASGIRRKYEHLKDHTQIGERNVLPVKIEPFCIGGCPSGVSYF